MAKFKKLTKIDKARIYYQIDWEGGLDAAIDHGGIFDIVKGTVLESVLKNYQKALAETREALKSQKLEEAYLGTSEEDL